MVRDREGILDPPKRAATALAVVLLIALVARLWELGTIPTVFFHDECDNTVNAIEILLGKGPGLFGLDWKPQPALGVHEIALAIRALRPSVTAIRLPSAILSVLALAPFFLLARRAAGPLAALLATLLLSTNPGYLHFSRSGWENVQVCLYTLVAIEAVARAEGRRSILFWAIAGFAAALSALIYFAGRATIGFLLVYGLVAILRGGKERGTIVRGLAMMTLTFFLSIAPLLPTLRANWRLFNRRTEAVLATQELPPGYSLWDLAEKLATNADRSARTFFDGRVNNEPRYFIVGRPFLDRLEASLLVIGCLASLRSLHVTAIWWLAWLVPFLLTQVLPAGSPNLARGIALLPITYLFVALGMRTLETLFATRRGLMQAILVLLVGFSAVRAGRDYFTWASSAGLAAALQPAVELADFPEWWSFQNRWVAENRGFFNVGMWLARKGVAGTVPSSAEPASSDRAEPKGRIYHGSTESRPYQIDLGTIALRGEALEATISAVAGFDCVYDYLETVAADGSRIRVEAEDPRYTTGDQPVLVHLPDNHWWLQDYRAFSGGKGLVALKSESPPPLVTRVALPPGSYRVLLGSFTGDPANGVFAIRASLQESRTKAESASSPASD